MGGFRSLGIRPIISRVITEPTAPTRRRIKKRHLIEFIKFGVVGGSGFLVNIIVAIIMNKANGGTEPMGREDKPCKRCGTLMSRIQLMDRSSTRCLR